MFNQDVFEFQAKIYDKKDGVYSITRREFTLKATMFKLLDFLNTKAYQNDRVSVIFRDTRRNNVIFALNLDLFLLKDSNDYIDLKRFIAEQIGEYELFLRDPEQKIFKSKVAVY